MIFVNHQNAKLGSVVPVLKLQPEPVFIVGMNGSGTSMLAESLGRHPLLYATPRETKVIPHLVGRLDNFGDLRQDERFLQLWIEVQRVPVFRIMNGGVAPSIPANWNLFPRDLAAVLDALFRSLAAREGKVRWGEKTPQHVQHLQMLHELFPRARFVHIIRDGRDCAASFHRRWGRTPERTIYRWRRVVREGRRQGSTIPNLYFEVRYEDLTQDPERWMREICSFLHLPFDPKVLGSRRPQSETPGGEGRISPNSGRWKQHFSSSQVARLEQISGAFLADLGYEVLNPSGARDPSALVSRYWHARDNIRETSATVRKRLTGKTGKSWSMIWQSIVVSIKQSRTNRY